MRWKVCYLWSTDVRSSISALALISPNLKADCQCVPSPRSSTMNPLKLETLALREVITKNGLYSNYTGLMVPKMRQELEQL